MCERVPAYACKCVCLCVCVRVLAHRDLLSDAKLKASVVSTQVTVHEQLRAVSRTRLAVASGPQACAALAGEVSGVVTDIQTLLGQLEELTETVKRYMEAGRNVPVDPVALQVRDCV